MINVFATIVANPGDRASVLEAFQEMRPSVLEEDGCIEYQASVDAPGAEPHLGSDTFAVTEKWQSQEALNAHMEGLALGSFLGKVKANLASVTIHVLSPV